MKLTLLDAPFAVCRLDPHDEIPPWVNRNFFWTVTQTREELSLVCHQTEVPAQIKAEKDFRIIKVAGTLDFALTGILASIAKPLAEIKVSIFAISTFDTDYILVREKDLVAARAALEASGFIFISN